MLCIKGRRTYPWTTCAMRSGRRPKLVTAAGGTRQSLLGGATYLTVRRQRRLVLWQRPAAAARAGPGTGPRDRCWASVQERYGACKAGRPIPQLVIWRLI